MPVPDINWYSQQEIERIGIADKHWYSRLRLLFLIGIGIPDKDQKEFVSPMRIDIPDKNPKELVFLITNFIPDKHSK